MSFAPAGEQRRRLDRDNAKQPLTLQPIPPGQWPQQGTKHMRVLRSRDFFVQEFAVH